MPCITNKVVLSYKQSNSDIFVLFHKVAVLFVLLCHRDVGASAQTYHVGARFEALTEGVLMAPLDPRYTQVGFNLISVQVWQWNTIGANHK